MKSISYVKNGQLTDLTDYYANASDEFKSIWSEDEMKGTTVDGKIYAVPNLRNFGNIIGLNIDADIAAEFGIENGQKLTMEEIDGITIEVPAPNKVIIHGIDKQKVGQFAANVRAKRPPEPYKGKGIKYATEVLRHKEGKAGGKK